LALPSSAFWSTWALAASLALSFRASGIWAARPRLVTRINAATFTGSPVWFPSD